MNTKTKSCENTKTYSCSTCQSILTLFYEDKSLAHLVKDSTVKESINSGKFTNSVISSILTFLKDRGLIEQKILSKRTSIKIHLDRLIKYDRLIKNGNYYVAKDRIKEMNDLIKLLLSDKSAIRILLDNHKDFQLDETEKLEKVLDELQDLPLMTSYKHIIEKMAYQFYNMIGAILKNFNRYLIHHYICYKCGFSIIDEKAIYLDSKLHLTIKEVPLLVDIKDMDLDEFALKGRLSDFSEFRTRWYILNNPIKKEIVTLINSFFEIKEFSEVDKTFADHIVDYNILANDDTVKEYLNRILEGTEKVAKWIKYAVFQKSIAGYRHLHCTVEDGFEDKLNLTNSSRVFRGRIYTYDSIMKNYMKYLPNIINSKNNSDGFYHSTCYCDLPLDIGNLINFNDSAMSVPISDFYRDMSKSKFPPDYYFNSQFCYYHERNSTDFTDIVPLLDKIEAEDILDDVAGYQLLEMMEYKFEQILESHTKCWVKKNPNDTISIVHPWCLGEQ